ncbi:hypothetical protein [Xenorhabdus bovienii]|uniref:Uncharacterized protein n=1 Tax=Xenorhabdus bovienii TaxID=40576 RepID=A0A0B6XDD5_XENBV|nr:hypothetical protein [Xenorhabdus bovienii]CDM90778.1 protein of unknown function [Xenorhabdus bovienii]
MEMIISSYAHITTTTEKFILDRLEQAKKELKEDELQEISHTELLAFHSEAKGAYDLWCKIVFSPEVLSREKLLNDSLYLKTLMDEFFDFIWSITSK